jgi:DNA-binding NtrC family response regulator
MIVVLVADDVAAISLALEDAVVDAGYRAAVFSSNAMALAWLSAGQDGVVALLGDLMALLDFGEAGFGRRDAVLTR